MNSTFVRDLYARPDQFPNERICGGLWCSLSVRTQELVRKYEKEIQIIGDAINQRKTLVAEDIRSLLGMNGERRSG